MKYEREEKIEVRSQRYKMPLILRNQACNLRILAHTIACKGTENKKRKKKEKKRKKRHNTKVKNQNKTSSQLAKETWILKCLNH